MDARELYREMILDHSRRPRNLGLPAETNRRARGDNPLCGDRIEVGLVVEDGVVARAGFEGAGCAICMASASTMTETIQGMDADQLQGAFDGMRALLTGRPTDATRLGKLVAFAGVAHFPMRIKCATLAWHAAGAAMRQTEPIVSTE